MSVIGKWKLRSICHMAGQEYDTVQYITIKEDGTFSEYDVDTEETFYGCWKVSSRSMTLSYDEGCVRVFHFSGKYKFVGANSDWSYQGKKIHS